MEKELICISCPLGCLINVKKENGEFSFSGYTCKRGYEYAKEEMTNPKRMVTSTVKVEESNENVVSVKTSKAIPKEMIFKVMEEINKVSVKAPIKNGQVIIKNILTLDSDIIATREIV